MTAKRTIEVIGLKVGYWPFWDSQLIWFKTVAFIDASHRARSIR